MDLFGYLCCVLMIMSLIQGKECCRFLEYLECWENKRMSGHVIRKIKVQADTSDPPGLLNCKKQCFYDNHCVSYNVGPIGVGPWDAGLVECELNGADHWMRNTTFVVNKTGYRYCPIKNRCSSNPCPDNRLCTPDFYNDGYSCSDGGWSQWGSWSACINKDPSSPQVRERTCDNPPPLNNGASCFGPATDPVTQECNF